MRKSTDKDNFGFAGDLPLRSGLLLSGDSSYIRIGERFSPYSNITLQKTEIASTLSLSPIFKDVRNKIILMTG
jgi:hypothetical protein